MVYFIRDNYYTRNTLIILIFKYNLILSSPADKRKKWSSVIDSKIKSIKKVFEIYFKFYFCF